MDPIDEAAFEADEAASFGEAAGRRAVAGARVRSDEYLHPDPASFGWPPTLAVEIALRVGSTKDICEAYGITREEWRVIAANKAFIAELAGAVEMVRQDGMAFKARARLQALDLLKTSWQLIHDPATPPNVRADLIKSTINWAGYNESLQRPAGGLLPGAGGGTSGFHINIILGDKQKTIEHI